jgi:tetratricopeptide (TPR) repeat protein
LSKRRLVAGSIIAVAGIAILAGVGFTRDSAPAPAVARAAAPPTPAPSASTPDEAIEATDLSAPIAFDALDAKRSASAAYASGDYARALSELEAAVAASPQDADARNNLAQLLVRHGRSAEALPHLDEAVRLDGTRWQYRFNRARTYGLLNRWPEAVREYQVAAQQFPDDHATLYNLGLAQLRVKDYAGAAVSLERAVAAAPDEHDFLITLGTAYVGAGQADRARATFERFLEVAPNAADAAKVKSLLQALAESAS